MGSLWAQEPMLLPTPQKFDFQDGRAFVAEQVSTMRMIEDFPDAKEHLEVFAEALLSCKGARVKSIEALSSAYPDLSFVYNPELKPEGYTITVDRYFSVEFADMKGLTHATATLLQLWPIPGESLASLRIEDAPAVSYRSLMVDLGRNPHSLAVLKETIDLLWFYKVDSLHLHLTDDQRFAFPSKAFPKLVSKEGAISWEEFESLEHYARVRGITLIPELEAPGHSSLLTSIYPEVFGKNSTEVASLPSSREGLKILLDEMTEVFASSPYVHVGCDEAYGVPAELQRDLVNELHAHLAKKGKRTVVWEGPPLGEGENKVHPDVIHINWRTIEFPADQMLEAGYPVINAAWDPLYVVDHYPRNNFTMAAPGHIYRTLDRFRFKHFNPDIPTFAQPIRVEPTDQVIGYCMPWWEGREVYFSILVPPRLAAMAEVAWREPIQRNEADFLKRLTRVESLRKYGFQSIMPILSGGNHPGGGMFVSPAEMSIEGNPLLMVENGVIRYTLDGSDPDAESARYESPFVIKDRVEFRAQLFIHGQGHGHVYRAPLIGYTPKQHLAYGKSVSSNVSSDNFFGTWRLTDGDAGNLHYYLGYPATPEQPVEVTIDLETIQTVQQVTVSTYQHGESHESYEILVSQDGKQWETVAARRDKPEQASRAMSHSFAARSVRFVRVRSFGHHGQVFSSFSRMTEIAVE